MRIHFATKLLQPSTECQHGPLHWPWWKLVSFSWVKLTVQKPSTGYALWIYTRGKAPIGDKMRNTGRYIDIYFDRRRKPMTFWQWVRCKLFDLHDFKGVPDATEMTCNVCDENVWCGPA